MLTLPGGTGALQLLPLCIFTVYQQLLLPVFAAVSLLTLALHVLFLLPLPLPSPHTASTKRAGDTEQKNVLEKYTE